MKIKFMLNESPKKRDLLDAIEHLESFNLDQSYTLSDFRLEYLGLLKVKDIEEYDDLSSWMEVDDVDDLETFRGSSWKHHSETWLTTGVPPIVIITGPDGETMVGDGRGRVNFANAHKLLIPAYHLIYNG